MADSCYHIASDLKVPHSGAIEVCWNAGGYLALITKNKERNAVQAYLDSSWLWIDGSDAEQEGNWLRHTGAEIPNIPFKGLGGEEPNGGKAENCLFMNYFLLGDWKCDDSYKALCEMNISN